MKIVFIVLGFIFAGLGAFGAAMPLIPATPFLVLSAIFFAKGSEKFHNYFINTKLYKNNIDLIVNKKAMDNKRKFKILAMITLTFAIAFFFLNHIHGRIVLIVVLLGHYYYFIFKIKTVKESSSDR